jgi:hypothetical protein
MGRVILGAVIGFIAWSVIWVGSEKAMSAIWPDWYGAHQVAFEKAVTEGGDFTPDTTILVLNIVRGALLAILSGFLAAVIARENKRSPLILGVLLVAFCVMIMSMAKSYVPVWYMVIFTLVFLPMTIVGGKLKKFA